MVAFLFYMCYNIQELRDKHTKQGGNKMVVKFLKIDGHYINVASIKSVGVDGSDGSTIYMKDGSIIYLQETLQDVLTALQEIDPDHK